MRAYRDAGEDPGDDALIAFYAAYRALVRAKVALVRAAQHPSSSAEHGRESVAARAEFNRLTYTELGGRAAREVAARGGVLVDATFRHRSDRDAFTAAFDHPAPLLFVECSAPSAVLAQRAARREHDRTRISDATVAVVQRESSTWEPLDEVAADAHLTLRTDRRGETVAADLMALLDQRIGSLAGRQPEPG